MYATGGEHKNVDSIEALKKTFNAWTDPHHGEVEQDGDYAMFQLESLPDGTTGVFTQNGRMLLNGQELTCSVYYSSTGPGGKGYMLILPNDSRLTQTNSEAAAALIHFLGCLTKDDYQQGAEGAPENPLLQPYVIESVAAVRLRADFDFASGTAVMYAIMTGVIKAEGDETGDVKNYAVLQIGPTAYFAQPR